jgi:hypothetical protein
MEKARECFSMHCELIAGDHAVAVQLDEAPLRPAEDADSSLAPESQSFQAWRVIGGKFPIFYLGQKPSAGPVQN